MNRLAILFLFILCIATNASAQSFTQHLQKKEPGKGKVTVTQSRQIDNLVNGMVKQHVVTEKPVQQKNNKEKKVVAGSHKVTSQKKHVSDDGQYIGAPRHFTPVDKDSLEKAKEQEKKRQAEKEAEERRRAEALKEQKEEEMHIPTVDMRKKVMRGSRKVRGYRVQAYAGGNKRADKLRAQRIGEAIKMRFPEQPVYVHFYSPRWICRVGNYRSYGEAAKMLRAIKAMGYRSATIVKGRITVFE